MYPRVASGSPHSPLGSTKTIVRRRDGRAQGDLSTDREIPRIGALDQVPWGLSGPGGIIAGSLAAQHPGWPRHGLIQLGFSTLLTTCHTPIGVVNPYLAVATG